jgi:hypothetical protein
MADKEALWRLKSRAIWLASGDENTKFFHSYAKGRKLNNTIWSLNQRNGQLVNTFEGLSSMGITHFTDLFKAPLGSTIGEIVKDARIFPHFVEEEERESLMDPVSEQELLAVMKTFQKGKSPRPDGWPIEFFLGFFDLIGNDIPKVVEESHGKMDVFTILSTATFIALIPKSNNPASFDDFHPISLCNCIYKIISKIISIRLKDTLSQHISGEQFGFLKGRQIHEAIGVAQEGLHNMKTKKLKGAAIKIDLSKAFDRVNWLYIHMLLIHLGFDVAFTNWIMACLTSVSFSLLINGSVTSFFRAERGLRQGCPLSPLLFLLVAECLSRYLHEEKATGSFRGIKITHGFYISHLLFVDDILIFCDGSRQDIGKLCDGLLLFKHATGMEINKQKSSITFSSMEDEEILYFLERLPFQSLDIEEGLKYLGFLLKPNDYRKTDWQWLLEKLEKRLKCWSQCWLSRAGRLVLIKSVLEAIPVYWMSLAWIPKGTLDKMRKLCFTYLWQGNKDKKVLPWV